MSHDMLLPRVDLSLSDVHVIPVDDIMSRDEGRDMVYPLEFLSYFCALSQHLYCCFL